MGNIGDLNLRHYFQYFLSGKIKLQFISLLHTPFSCLAIAQQVIDQLWSRLHFYKKELKACIFIYL